ncbi:MAG TPA: sortase [Candidatus Moranbacteria bacterium]|nr:sortase [Candidatus Moranbacteria bacterium]
MRKLIVKFGWLLIISSLALLLAIFWNVIKNEISYFFSKKSNEVKIVLEDSVEAKNGTNEVVPADKDFGLIIPKLKLNVKVFPDVDPQNEGQYLSLLKEGVAHAKNSGRPESDKQIFIFAHSSENFYVNNQYNSIFYLLGKLETGDKVHLIHENSDYQYQVREKRIVKEIEVDYLSQEGSDLVLMTCWPPGTALERLLVIAEPL